MINQSTSIYVRHKAWLSTHWAFSRWRWRVASALLKWMVRQPTKWHLTSYIPINRRIAICYFLFSKWMFMLIYNYTSDLCFKIRNVFWLSHINILVRYLGLFLVSLPYVVSTNWMDLVWGIILKTQKQVKGHIIWA